MTSQNGQIHFRSLAAFAARLLKVSVHFGTLFVRELTFFLCVLRSNKDNENNVYLPLIPVGS